MPVDDVIFERLRRATSAERAELAKILEVKLTGASDVDNTAISKELRSAGGNSFGNLFRDDHELPYRELLADALKAAGQAASFPEQEVTLEARDAWLEDYIVEALAFAIRSGKEVVPADEKAAALTRAQDALQGRSLSAPVVSTTTLARLGFLAGGLAAGLAGITVLPFAVAFMGLKWASPAVKKTLPAIQVLIHIRKRLEAEATLETEEKGHD